MGTAGFDEAQAEAAVSMVRDALGSDRDRLATKADLAALGAATRADLAAAIAGLERHLIGYGLAIAGLLFAALKLFRHTADAIRVPPCPRDRP